MAKEKITNVATKDPKKDAIDALLSEGFQKGTPDRAVAYWRPTENTLIRGVLVGRFRRRDKNEFFYQLKLLTAIDAKDRENNDIEAGIGDILQVDERARIVGLAAYAEREETFEVVITCGERRKIDNGKTMWEMDFFVKKHDPKSAPF